VSKLVLIEGVGLWPGMTGGGIRERLSAWMENTRTLAARQPRHYESLEAAFERMHKANAHLSEAQARHLTIHGTNQNEDGTFSWKFDNYTHAFPAFRMPEAEMIEIWQQISCPTLCLNATEGFGHRIGQDGTIKHFARGQVRDIGEAGHWVHHDQLDQVVAAVGEFLRDPLA
jgi:pimeloyl-ACP methyl ester carboxylesterase